MPGPGRSTTASSRAPTRSGFRVDGKKYVDQMKSTTRKVGPGDAYRAGTAAIGGIAGRGRVLRVRVHGRLDGLGGRREDHAPVRARASRTGGRRSCSAASGGARMQEGVLSLMQMAKTSRGAVAAARGARPVHLGAAAPDHRRRRGVGRDARRRHHRRARRADRLRRPARDRADDPPAAAARASSAREFLLEHGMVDMVVAAQGSQADARAHAALVRARARRRSARTGTRRRRRLEIPATD